MNRLHARLAALSRPATGFAVAPEPRTLGSAARGERLLAGDFFRGNAPETSIWDMALPDAELRAAAHGFAWLDDLAALGGRAARARAQDWTAEWLRRYGGGGGPGWRADLTGRRLMRCINHAPFLRAGADAQATARLERALARQTVFLSRRWQTAPPGLPRFEALAGLVQAALSLNGMDRKAAPAVAALARECRERIDAEGGLASRNPEELLQVFALLTGTAAILSEAGRMAPKPHLAAIARIAPTLRTLRHADGGLARFHGGGRGAPGVLDQALAAASVRGAGAGSFAMGYARLASGRTSVIVDAAAPPPSSATAHAGTLAVEITSGRRPLIVNCGTGAAYGTEWRRAGRATPSHSVLAIRGVSSARLAPRGRIVGAAAERLTHAPRDVRATCTARPDGKRVTASHDGYRTSHGLTHLRRLFLAAGGESLSGEDTVEAISAADRRAVERARDRTDSGTVVYEVRFHLHPEVTPALEPEIDAVWLRLKSGELWVFRHDGAAALTLEPSIYLEPGQRAPLATRAIVLTAHLEGYAGGVGWRLAKDAGTAYGLRDLEYDDPMPKHASERS